MTIAIAAAVGMTIFLIGFSYVAGNRKAEEVPEAVNLVGAPPLSGDGAEIQSNASTIAALRYPVSGIVRISGWSYGCPRSSISPRRRPASAAAA